jgi:hypothetical protein
MSAVLSVLVQLGRLGRNARRASFSREGLSI